MKHVYIPVFILLLFAGCSKDFLRPYDDRIIGTWVITDIDKYGFGGSIRDLPFPEGGRFSFMRDGTMTYTSPSGETYQGTWDIDKKFIDDDDDDEVQRSLQITAVNFTSQHVLGEYYDNIVFTGTDRLNAWINSGSRSYVTHLRR